MCLSACENTCFFNCKGKVGKANALLIKFMTTLFLAIKRSIWFSYKKGHDIFYRLGWRKFLQPNLEENSGHK
jgi:hypothetical protein